MKKKKFEHACMVNSVIKRRAKCDGKFEKREK